MGTDERWIGPAGLLSATCLLAGTQSDGALSVVHHRLAPGILSGPPHLHHNEDEFSYVLEGTVSFQVGDELRTVEPGELVSKPRGTSHAFWNASADREARVLELIAPGGLEAYFAELSEIIPTVLGEPPDFNRLARAASEFGLELDMEAAGNLMATHRVRLPGM